MNKVRLGLSDAFGCALCGTVAGIAAMMVAFVATSILNSGLPFLSAVVMVLVASVVALPLANAILVLLAISFICFTNGLALGVRKVSAFIVFPVACAGSGLALSFLLMGQPALVLSMAIAGGMAGLAMAGAAARALGFRAAISLDVDGKGRRLFVPGWMGWR